MSRDQVLYHRVFLGYCVLPEHGRGSLLGTVCEAVRISSPSLVHSVLVGRGAAASGEVGGMGGVTCCAFSSV